MRIAAFVQTFAIALVLAWVLAGVQATKPATTPPSAQTATAFYLEYRAAYDKASTLDDVLPYWSIDKRNEAEAMPGPVRALGFQSLKSANVISNVTVQKEETTAAGATLTVEGVRPDKTKKTGTVTLVKEGDAWKIAGERWK